MRRPVRSSVALLFLCALAACSALRPAPPDPLPSWRDGAARSAIVSFVSAVTDPDGPDYLPPAERVAAFDNDGTLMAERPRPAHAAFLYAGVVAAAARNPDWSVQTPYAPIVAGDLGAADALGYAALGALSDAVQAGLTETEMDRAAMAFVAGPAPPGFRAPVRELAYAPMLELVRYLEAAGFRVFVVSASGVDFLRAIGTLVYGLPPERFIGTATKYAVSEQAGAYHVVHAPGFSTLNAGRFKAINLRLHVGVRPVLAVGNSDGDLDMLRYASGGPRRSLVLLVDHDDADREYAYRDETERLRAEAATRGWRWISMRYDFGRVFSGASE